MTRVVLIVAFVLGLLAAYFVFWARISSDEVPEPVLGIMRSDPSPYELGYETGRRAFLVQMGEEVEPVVRYTSSVVLDREESDRGYVDGYHRAAETYNCPRPAQK